MDIGETVQHFIKATHERHILPFKTQPHKMVKHTQTLRRLLPTNYLSVFDHFVGLTLKNVNEQSLPDTPPLI